VYADLLAAEQLWIDEHMEVLRLHSDDFAVLRALKDSAGRQLAALLHPPEQ
jgi:hypothetical protein